MFAFWICGVLRVCMWPLRHQKQRKMLREIARNDKVFDFTVEPTPRHDFAASAGECGGVCWG